MELTATIQTDLKPSELAALGEKARQAKRTPEQQIALLIRQFLGQPQKKGGAR